MATSRINSRWQYKSWLLALCVAAAAATACRGDAIPGIRHFPRTGTLHLEYRDELKTPLYSWPRTLLSYPVEFSDAAVRPDEVGLVDAGGQAIPVQLSDLAMRADGTLLHARVNFFGDLPPGAVRSFELTKSGNAKSADAVVSQTASGVIEINAGTLQIRIPQSQTIAAGQSAPGPILAVNRGQGWIGESKLISPNKNIERVETVPIDNGDLFKTYRITYTFTGGGAYIATVKTILNYPFVDFREEMSGLNPEDQAFVENIWSGFSPTKRFAANGWMCPPEGRGISDPVLTGGNREEPSWFPQDFVEDPARDMIFRLASFEGNAPRFAVPVMSFWDDRAGGQELSLFIPDTKDWNDGQYGIWQPTTRLQVHFRFADGTLYFRWPLVSGTRRTGLTLHDAKQGAEQVAATRKMFVAQCLNKNGKFEGAFYQGVHEVEMRHAQQLRSWYGGLDLNRAKDWVLTYPHEPINTPLKLEGKGTAKDLETRTFQSALMIYPLGLDLASMNINHRVIRPLVQDYLRVQNQLTSEQRARINAALLLSAYVNAGEDISPIRTCITGCPNMSADGFAVPAELSVLFPKHPMAREWADQFEKAIDLMGCFYTRPDVKSYGSLGGRWAESFGVYNWAYFIPTFEGQTALMLAGDHNRFANRWMAQRGRWMVDELSAPVFNSDPYARQKSGFSATSQPANWQPGDALAIEKGFERQYPAHGAHGSGTGIEIPSATVPVLGNYLSRFDPITAEHLLWAGTQGMPNTGMEGPIGAMGQWEISRLGGNTGTNPHLESCKYTGHGIILRAGVGTPEELSIHLDQVDQGPNYRWGNNGEGSSGTIYYFAGGKVWSGHERENTGDHQNDDSTGNTNFSVVTRGAYRTIGENLLERPLLNLDVAQFAEITARQGPGAYSWPAYKSRSIMLVGTDYMIIADDAQGPGRFSWFTVKDMPFPKIAFLNPLSARTDHLATMQTQMSKGILRDTGGPSVVLVSHKLDGVELEAMTAKPYPVLETESIKQYAPARGNTLPQGVYLVKTPTSHDRVFRNLKTIDFNRNDESFTGTAGVIRSRNDGSTELSLFGGTRIAAKGVELTVADDQDFAISASFTSANQISGMFVAAAGGELKIRARGASSSSLYIDGSKQQIGREGYLLTVTLPAGRHVWELTAGQPKPLPPVIDRTENGPESATVFYTPVAGATGYRIELSSDGGKNWREATRSTSDHATLTSMPAQGKVHVRVIAINDQKQSDPGREYPIYLSAKPPLAPEGIWLDLAANQVSVSWGQILGVKEYRLYRRVAGQQNWQMIYAGLNRSFLDANATGATPPAALPGSADNISFTPPNVPVYEYAISAVDGNGEGDRSVIVNSAPTNWRNWWPADQERKFKRQSAFWLPPYVPHTMTPPARYPD